MERTFQLNDIDTVAKDLLTSHAEVDASHATVIGFTGNLGSGKTTLAQAVARVLGVTEHVTSPTFVLQKNYQLQQQPFDALVHIDAYRLESLDELGPLRFEELLTQPRTLVLIEWPERIQAALPSHTKIFKLNIVDEQTRQLTTDH